MRSTARWRRCSALTTWRRARARSTSTCCGRWAGAARPPRRARTHQGAGQRRHLRRGHALQASEIAASYGVNYLPIISSARAFSALWKRAYHKAAEWLAAVVYEDPWLQADTTASATPRTRASRRTRIRGRYAGPIGPRPSTRAGRSRRSPRHRADRGRAPGSWPGDSRRRPTSRGPIREQGDPVEGLGLPAALPRISPLAAGHLISDQAIAALGKRIARARSRARW